MKNSAKASDKLLKEIKKNDFLSVPEETLIDGEDDFTLEERSDEFVPIVFNKAKNSELNLNRQYKRRVNHCQGRKVFRIHDFTKPGDHGSKDKSLVYVEFQGGMFEAMKKNLVAVLKKRHGVVKTNDPKVETFGKSEAEERFCLDMKMVVAEHSHNLKVKIYNTACSLDAQGLSKEMHTIFKHLDNKTVHHIAQFKSRKMGL